MHFEPWQWVLLVLGAVAAGFSKTGIPGIGILIVPLMAIVFGGRLSVGATLPLLIFGDIFAVLWYRQHARWDNLRSLFPWVSSQNAPIVGGLLAYTAGTARFSRGLPRHAACFATPPE